MREFENNITITGKLVSTDIEERTTKDGVDCIVGSIVLRTSDNSEHKINVFSNKYKKDENKNITSEENYFYGYYKDFIENAKTIENSSEEEADIVRISDGVFTINDFKSKNGEVISSNKISAKFINVLSEKDKENSVCESTFSVEGIIGSLVDEVENNVPTGKLIVNFNIISQKNNGSYGSDADYVADKLVPVKLIIDDVEMVNCFRSIGYYEGCFAKLYGRIINSVQITEKVEKAAFGTDQKKVFTSTVRKNVIEGGTAPRNIYEEGLTDDIVNALITKRKATLAEVKSNSSSSNTNGFSSAPNNNPFAQGKVNPFN